MWRTRGADAAPSPPGPAPAEPPGPSPADLATADVPETSIPSLEEATAALTAPGQLFEMEEVDIRGVPTRVWKNCPASLQGDPRALPRPRRHRLSRLRGRAHHLRGALPHRGDDRPGAARPLRRRARRPCGHRHAQPPGVGHGVLGRGRGRRRGGAPERVVDEPRAPLRAGGSGTTAAFVDAARLERLAAHLADLPELRAVVVTHEDRVAAPTLPESAVPAASFAKLVGPPTAP